MWIYLSPILIKFHPLLSSAWLIDVAISIARGLSRHEYVAWAYIGLVAADKVIE